MYFPSGSVVKNPPANAGDSEMQDISLGEEDPLKEEMATHSSILASKILWTGEPGRLKPIALQRVGHVLATKQQREE